MAMSLVSGVSNITINGRVFAPGDDLVKFSMSTINREPVVSKNGTVYIKETPQAAKLSFTILCPPDVDVSTFNAQTSSNIVVSLATGAVLNANSFATSGENEFDSGEGKLSLEYFGPRINVSLGN